MNPTPEVVALNTEHQPNTMKFAFFAMTALFFIWGFITALNDILLPYLKDAFALSFVNTKRFCRTLITTRFCRSRSLPREIDGYL